MSNKIKVIETQGGTVLFECPLEDADMAYRYAVEMESHGIDVKISSPSGPETLADSLGVSEEEKEKLRQILQQEIEDHDDSCLEGCSMTSLRPETETKH